MSLTAVRRCTKVRLPLRRWVSHDAHHDHHHHESHETYAPEGFLTPFWRNSLLVALGLGGAYNYFPDAFNTDGGKHLITRYIVFNSTKRETTEDRNVGHLALTIEGANERLLVQQAQRPKIYRYRNPSLLDAGSPHCVGVGDEVDMNFEVKDHRADQRL